MDCVERPVELRTKAAMDADIRTHRRTALVVNVRSRRGRRHYETVRRRLRAAGLDVVDAQPVAHPAQLPDILARAVNSGADLIVVGGGDGTLSEATHQLAHRDVCLGVLPLGTTNNFARSLGLPLHLPAALRILTEGKVADVDLGHVAGRHFANLTSLGLSVQVAEHVPHLLKRILGRAAYPLTALALLPRHRPFTARLGLIEATGDDGEMTGRGDDGDDRRLALQGPEHLQIQVLVQAAEDASGRVVLGAVLVAIGRDCLGRR